jgi:predicted PhzF superfamily epimerase YddE/YHI9
VTRLHVVRVFVGPGDGGGNLLGVFLEGSVIVPERRVAVTAELGFSETVFVDDVDQARVAIFLPTTEVPFAGHPAVGTAWLLGDVGRPATVLRPPAGEVPTWRDADVTWIRVPPAWVQFAVMPQFVQFDSVAEVDALPPRSSEPFLYAWAWEDEALGKVRVRSFPTWAGIVEDEAGGAPAVLMGARMKRPLTIRQGVGSEIQVEPSSDGTVAIGGRCALVEVRDYPT